MRNRRKRAQREEVRKILHEIRLQLAAQRLSQDKRLDSGGVLKLNEFFGHVRETAS